MKSQNILFFVLFSLSLTGCQSELRTNTSQTKGVASDVQRIPETKGLVQAGMQQVSLQDADQSQSIAEAMDRKITSSADLTLEVAVPSAAQQTISSIAASVGGFVVTSESKQRESADSGKQQLEVTLVLRVPAMQFDSALNQIRGTGSRVIQEKITGEDVTEEFIDLEARLKTQKALEAQFLQIMKQATKVVDALEVQRQIAEVRTDVEKLEGRKRFLQNRASLSTITISLQTPAAIVVNTSSFGRSVKETFATSLDLSTGIVLMLIRMAIVSIPILILIVVPASLVGRHLLRRAKRLRLARKLESVPSTN